MKAHVLQCFSLLLKKHCLQQLSWFVSPASLLGDINGAQCKNFSGETNERHVPSHKIKHKT
jgi:hypothetical protein